MTIAVIHFQGRVSRHFANLAAEELALAETEVRTSCSQLPPSKLQPKILEIAVKHLSVLNKTINDQKEAFNSSLNKELVQRLMVENINSRKKANVELFTTFVKEMVAELSPPSLKPTIS